jgi:hypothetical protein
MNGSLRIRGLERQAGQGISMRVRPRPGNALRAASPRSLFGLLVGRLLRRVLRCCARSGPSIALRQRAGRCTGVGRSRVPGEGLERTRPAARRGSARRRHANRRRRCTGRPSDASVPCGFEALCRRVSRSAGPGYAHRCKRLRAGAGPAGLSVGSSQRGAAHWLRPVSADRGGAGNSHGATSGSAATHGASSHARANLDQAPVRARGDGAAVK